MYSHEHAAKIRTFLYSCKFIPLFFVSHAFHFDICQTFDAHIFAFVHVYVLC